MSYPPRHIRRNEHKGGPTPSPVVGPLKSINGWVLFARGIHEEAQDEDLSDLFSDFGKVKSLHLNQDRRTGLAKGYCMIEFEKKEEAQDAINSLHGTKFLNRKISVDWCFTTTPSSGTSTIERGRHSFHS